MCTGLQSIRIHASLLSTKIGRSHLIHARSCLIKGSGRAGLPGVPSYIYRIPSIPIPLVGSFQRLVELLINRSVQERATVGLLLPNLSCYGSINTPSPFLFLIPSSFFSFFLSHVRFLFSFCRGHLSLVRLTLISLLNNINSQPSGTFAYIRLRSPLQRRLRLSSNSTIRPFGYPSHP